MAVRVAVRGLPAWIDPTRALGPFAWHREDDALVARLSRRDAADLQARTRGIGLGGQPLTVSVEPSLKRSLVRAARSEDAKRRRDTTPGFTRKGTKLDDEGRMSLTAESIALELGRRAGGVRVLDACGGCGGNAIGFARAGCRVELVEPHPGRLHMAAHNARIYGVHERIAFTPGRAEEIAATAEADLLFVDPPWGADWDRKRTGLEHVPLLPKILEHSDRFERTWLKLPPSFDVSELPGWRPSAWFGLADGDRQRVKFLLLTRRRRLTATELLLKDGNRVYARRIGPEDRDRLQAGLAGLSEESRIQRFHAGMSRLSKTQLRYLTEVDQYTHIAWGVVDPDEPTLPGLGVVRAIAMDHVPGAVELAIAVADAYHGMGLGTLLLGLISLDASRKGYHTLIGRVRLDNEPMLGLLRKLGAAEIGRDGPVIELALDLSDLSAWPESSATRRLAEQLPDWPSS